MQLLGRGATGGQVLFANLVEAGVVALTGSLAGSGLAWAVLAFLGGVPVAPVLAGGAATWCWCWDVWPWPGSGGCAGRAGTRPRGCVRAGCGRRWPPRRWC